MAVREGILALLHERPSHGYELKTQFEMVTGGVWPLNIGQVYTTLDRLERDGFVELLSDDDQKVYGITDAGVEELGAWWQTVPKTDPPPRDELVLKVLMSIGVSHQHGLDVISQQRSILTSMLMAHRKEQVETPPTSQAAALVGESVISRAEADLRWLATCEQELMNPRLAKGVSS